MRRHHPAKWHLRNMQALKFHTVENLTRHFPDLGSASNWSKEIFNHLEAQPWSWKWRVISMEFLGSFLDQTSLRGETCGGIGKRRLFSRLRQMAWFVFLWSVSLARCSKKLCRKWMLKKCQCCCKKGNWTIIFHGLPLYSLRVMKSRKRKSSRCKRWLNSATSLFSSLFTMSFNLMFTNH